MVGVQPQRHRFVRRPNPHAGKACPEDIVIQLVAKQKLTIVFCRPLLGVLAFRALGFENVEHEVIAAVPQPY